MATKLNNEKDPAEKLDDFAKSIPNLKAWADGIMKNVQGLQKSQPKVTEKRTCKIGKVTIKVSLCDNGAIAIEFPDQKTAEKYFFEHFKPIK